MTSTAKKWLVALIIILALILIAYLAGIRVSITPNTNVGMANAGSLTAAVGYSGGSGPAKGYGTTSLFSINLGAFTISFSQLGDGGFINATASTGALNPNSGTSNPSNTNTGSTPGIDGYNPDGSINDGTDGNAANPGGGCGNTDGKDSSSCIKQD